MEKYVSNSGCFGKCFYTTADEHDLSTQRRVYERRLRHDDDCMLLSRKVMGKFMNGLIVVFEGMKGISVMGMD